MHRPNIENGFVIPSNGPRQCGATVTYQCNANFNLVGRSQLICQNDRQWSARAPFCQGKLLCPDS